MSEETALDTERDLTTRINEYLANLDIESVGVHAFLYGVAILFMAPYVYMFTASFQPRSLAMEAQPYWIPPEITFEHYQWLLENSLIVDWTINTFAIAGVATVLILIADSMIAYSLSRLDWPGRGILLSIIVASFMVPYYLNIVPLFTIVSDLNLVSSPWGVILPAVANPLGVFMLYQFFKDIPEEYEEAARLDGFSNFQIYSRIILPLSKPIMTALALFMFVYNWNAFLWPLIVLQSNQAYTLPIGLVSLQNAQIYRPGRTLASAVIAALPLLIVFLILQRYLVRAVELQGVTE
ncbi:carbohydrate ABC transporter permease [Halorhabdus amylolytica]|uniref:carbohydrate ABC transporter permease n=1 Tax=Halorhabdus amylolytica TaxID=2559573 RepID=UPI0010A9EBFB|nr:carbohydrate ABC transporter permease [Halorhabdus amylolytica]